MTQPRPLPRQLRTGPFTVAEALRVGVDRDRLRRRDLVAPFRGTRAAAATALDGEALARLALAVAPTCAFLCGASAASLHGIPLPPRLAFQPLVELAVPAPGRAVRRGGVLGRVLEVAGPDLTSVRGIPATTPERTWCDLAVALTVPELVAAGDWLARWGVATTSGLQEAALRRRDRRGAARIRGALPMLDPRSESPKESELRVLVRAAGFPTPAVNVDVVDDRGRFVARVDLMFAEYREILEYQGDHHRTDRSQWRRDRTREAELESLGYHVTEITDDDLLDPVGLVARLARTLRRRGWSGRLRSSDAIRRLMRPPGARSRPMGG